MPESRTTSGLDLHVELSGSHGHVALERSLRDAVRTGRLRPGVRLPSSRALARDLQVARGTVVEAYGQLVGEGWLVSAQGSGTRVADAVPTAPLAITTEPPSSRPPRFDLRAGSPDVSTFPRAAWLAATRRALATAPSEAFGYSDPRGRPELRTALADYLARARGVRADPDRIVVCSGFTQGVGLLCQVLRSRGATQLATEDHGLTGNRDAANAAGLDLRTLPVDDGGAVLDDLGDADAVLLTPAHQFPLGPVLAPARRTQVVGWAADTGGLLVEDDYDGEFRYDRAPVGAVQGRAPDSVVYAGSVSKTLAPGLRLGWLVVPGRLLDDVVAAKAAADRQATSLDQLVLADLLTSGVYDRHVRGRRLAYRRRRDQFVAELGRRAPAHRVLGIPAGLHAVVELPDGETEADTVGRAAQHGLVVEGLAAYRLGRRAHRPALVVGFATPPDHAYTATTSRLWAVLARSS